VTKGPPMWCSLLYVGLGVPVDRHLSTVDV
jgi:hypothetical protein